MVPRKVIATLLLLYMIAMLAKESEGYLAFYSREDFRRMQEKEKNPTQKKSLDARDFFEFAEDEGQVIKMIAPVEIGIHLNSRQLEKYQDVLKELLTEMLPDTKNEPEEIDKIACRLNSATCGHESCSLWLIQIAKEGKLDGSGRQ